MLPSLMLQEHTDPVVLLSQDDETKCALSSKNLRLVILPWWYPQMVLTSFASDSPLLMSKMNRQACSVEMIALSK